MSESRVLYGDCLDMLQAYVAESTANLIMTSPPCGNRRKHNDLGVEPASFARRCLSMGDSPKNKNLALLAATPPNVKNMRKWDCWRWRQAVCCAGVGRLGASRMPKSEGKSDADPIQLC